MNLQAISQQRINGSSGTGTHEAGGGKVMENNKISSRKYGSWFYFYFSSSQPCSSTDIKISVAEIKPTNVPFSSAMGK
jgi:hypothetical protein